MTLHLRQINEEDIPAAANPAVKVQQIVSAMIARRNVIGAIVLAAAVLGILIGFTKAPLYSATAIVQVGLAERETPVPQGQGSALQPPPMEILDREIQEARLLQSEALAHDVVLRLGLDHQKPSSFLGSVIAAILDFLPNRGSDNEAADAATRGILTNLVVRNEPRSNLIAVTYTANLPEEAAQISNAIVAEHVHLRNTQRLAARVAAARAEIRELSATYGQKHYMMGRANDALVQAEKELLSQQTSPPRTPAELAATGYIIPARLQTTPVGLPFSSVVGLAMLAGLVVAIAYALLDEFFGAEIKRNVAPSLNKYLARIKLLVQTWSPFGFRGT